MQVKRDSIGKNPNFQKVYVVSKRMSNFNGCRQKTLTALLTLKTLNYIFKKLLKWMVRCMQCNKGTVCPVIIHFELISQVLRLSSIKLPICEVW